MVETEISSSDTGIWLVLSQLLHFYQEQLQDILCFLIHHINWDSWKVFCFSFILTFISSVKELERPQMSDFSDGHNQDAIITMLITTRRRKRKRGGRKKWFNDFLQEYADCSPSSQLRSIVECSPLHTQTQKHMCACTHTHTQTQLSCSAPQGVDHWKLQIRKN